MWVAPGRAGDPCALTSDLSTKVRVPTEPLMLAQPQTGPAATPPALLLLSHQLLTPPLVLDPPPRHLMPLSLALY